MKSESNRMIKTKLKSSVLKVDLGFNSSQNNLNMTTNSKIDRTIKMDFNNSNNLYSGINMSKSNNDIGSRIEVTPSREDIYYDEIIYYDGGDVDGYGYDE